MASASKSRGAKARSTYPPPPPFFELYTTASKAEFDRDPERSTAASFWKPPPIPEKPFVKFGMPESTEPIAFELGSEHEKMYEEEPDGSIRVAYWLRVLLRRALKIYLEIVGGLVGKDGIDAAERLPPPYTSSQYHAPGLQKRLKEIFDVFSNMRHLLNVMRPIQARQTVISMLQRQVEETDEKRAQLELLIAQLCAQLPALSAGVAMPAPAGGPLGVPDDLLPPPQQLGPPGALRPPTASQPSMDRSNPSADALR